MSYMLITLDTVKHIHLQFVIYQRHIYYAPSSPGSPPPLFLIIYTILFTQKLQGRWTVWEMCQFCPRILVQQNEKKSRLACYILGF